MADRTTRLQIRKRLKDYWRFEIGNVFLLPVTIVYIAWMLDSKLGWLTFASFVPMCAMLMLGGLYWRGKLLALDGDAAALHDALKLADRHDWWLLVTSVVAWLAALASWLYAPLSVSLGDRIAATVCGTLAILEYVNYYHRQLQHFDHPADFARLKAGKGFRKSQMSSDLARFRDSSR